ncbi:MAG: AgmX/PglI C-terminal domain-containing protein [Polyangiales bacterium]
MSTGGVARALRVAAVWGDTVLASRVLRPGEIFQWKEGLGVSPPEGLPEEPVRAIGGGWELDPRGVVGGFLRLRGREEDLLAVSLAGAPVALMPGDIALLQYGSFALFAQPVAEAPLLPAGARWEPWVVLAVFLSGVGHVGLLYALNQLSTPTPVPEPLELLSDRDLKDRLAVKTLEEDEKEKPTGGEQSSGVTDPGLKTKKDQGGGKKIAGDAGKLGRNDGKGQTKLPGETPGVPVGSITDVIGSGAGQALADTLSDMKSIAATAGGLSAKDMQWGSGSGFAFKGSGPGGGGSGPGGVPYGSGGFNTGIGPGNGGGGGKGGGGPGGKGKGGPGGGGDGGPGEKKVAMVSSGGGGGKGFSADEIRRVVMSHLGQVRACYESALDSAPGLKGSVTIAWHISSSGAVPRATVASSTLNNTRVEGCITRVVKGWTFKNPEGVEADASWGFGLTPPG